MRLFANLAVLLAFAWVIRGLLGARGVTWRRLLVAVLLGYIVGLTLAGLLVIDVTALASNPAGVEIPSAELHTVALPFQVVAMMAAVVVFELVVSSLPRRHDLRPVRPIHALKRRVGITARMLRVSRITARHGLAPVLGLTRRQVPTRSPTELARRTRLALEDAGGMFVKLGQLLATRPDLMPPEALAELGRLHAAARPLDHDQTAATIAADIGDIDAVFSKVDWTPIGSASIAQAHAAWLQGGREVVLKVRRPGLEDVVERDLAIAGWLARTAEQRTTWGRVYGTTALADEFADALRTELDFTVEARATMEVAEAVASFATIRVPEIMTELSTERLLVMERLAGRTLSSIPRRGLPDNARLLADQLCESQVAAMLRGDRFHGDPHPGNVMLLDDGALGLIDFGVTGQLDAFERTSMFQLLVAIKLEQPSLLYEALVAIGAVSAVRQPDTIERALARYMAANLGPGLPPADALTDLMRLTTRLGIRLPSQASVMFRALATLAGTLELLSPGYPLIQKVAELGGAELRDRMAPGSVTEFVQQEWARLAPVLQRAPRHLDRLATLAEHGALAANVRLFADAADERVVERLVNRAVLTVLSLGVALVAVLMLGTDTGPQLAGTGIRLLEVLGWAGLFAGTVLLLRVLLDVLRTEAGHGVPSRRA